MRVASGAAGDGGAAGGVIGGGALGDVDGEGAAGDGPGDVGDGDGEQAMVMLVLPMGGGCCMGHNGWWPWAMHRVVVVLVVSLARVPQGGDSTGDGGAGDVSGEGVSGRRRWCRWWCRWWCVLQVLWCPA